ncbi:ABC transporter substrate-binding protein [Actinomadura sp. 3N508]|uniref:ABC transporter substrate-binding protein n=1 Tax=Actinomadura sp. 3N508 TaxID=3375153 RepID=UPI0037AE06C0
MRKQLFVAAAATFLMIASACSADKDDPNGGDGGGAAKPKQNVACPPLDEAAIDRSATFTWMYSVANTSFDPDKITTSNSWMYLYPVYDTLIRMDANGEPTPMLAKKWEVGDGGKSLTLNLIENWKYHDGTAFDAASVKANIDRHRSGKSFNKQALSDVTGVDVVNASTVKVNTKSGAAPLIGILSSSAGMMMSPKVFDDPNQASKPTGGSGAFKVTAYEPNTKVEYTPVPGYWDPKAVNVAKMVFLISSNDNARLNATITGTADSTFLRSSMYQPAKDAKLAVCQKPSLASFTIAVNTGKAPFDKKEVRQALNYAIDRNAINELQGGFCQPGVQMFPNNYYASDPSLGPDAYPHDPGKAKELLAKAGVTNLSFTLETDNLDAYQRVAELIQANLQEVGVKMTIRPVELPKLMEGFSVNKNVDAIMVQQKADADPSIQIASYYLPDGFSNPGAYSNPTITDLATKAKGAADRNAAKSIYQQLFKAAHDDAAQPITLCHLNTPLAMNNKVMGVEVYVDGSRQFRGVAVKK